MSSGCISISAVGCVDSRVPVRATYVNLYKWPESDAEFVKSVAGGRGGTGGLDYKRCHPMVVDSYPGVNYKRCHPRVVDSYSCRQMYLRSYTFSKKESVPEKTRKCLGKVKERVAVAVHTKRKKGIYEWGGGSSNGGGFGNSNSGSGGSGGEDDSSSNKRKRKKRCLVARRLREVSCSALYSIFQRLLSCTTSVDVVDRY